MADPAEIDFLGAPGLLALVLLVVFAASVVQFRLGLGFGLMAGPLLAVIDPELVPAPVLIVGFATATLGAWRERHAILWGDVLIGAAARVVGVVLVTLVLARLTDRDTFGLIFGLLVGAAVLMSLAGLRLRFSRPALFAMSVLSGIMGTITAVGAPPMAIIYQDRPPAQARPTLAAFFAVGCIASLTGLYASGWAGRRDLWLALFMLPGILAGLAVSRRLGGAAGDRRYRAALLAIAGAAACILIGRGLR